MTTPDNGPVGGESAAGGSGPADSDEPQPPVPDGAAPEDIFGDVPDMPEVPDDASSLTGDVRVAELTADLQRVQAEYANYRKRVARDQEAVREIAVLNVLTELLPVLDDIERAREHNELTGTFKVVAEALQSKLAKLGLETFGAVGEAFDPMLHEALTHTPAPEGAERAEGEAEGPVIGALFQPGFSYKGRVVRPARVGVTE